MPADMPWLKVLRKSYGGWSIEAGTGRGWAGLEIDTRKVFKCFILFRFL